MICPFLVPTTNQSPISHFPFPVPQSSLFHFPALVFPYTAASSLFRTRRLSLLWYPIRPSSDAYASVAMGNNMWTIWLIFLSLGAQWVLGGSYHCSSYGTANHFSSLDHFSTSLIGEPMLSSMAVWECPSLYWSCTSRASLVTAISNSSQQVPVGINNSVWIL